MKKIWFIVFCFSIFFSCENINNKVLNPIALVPEDSEILIKINASEGLENGLKNNALIKALQQYSEIKSLNTLLVPFHKINKNYSLIALSKKQNDSLSICYIVPLSESMITTDSITGLKIDSSYTSKNNIRKFIYNDSALYSTIIDSVLFVSNTLKLTEDAFATKDMHPKFESIVKLSDNDKMVSVYIDHEKNNINPIIFRDSTLNSVQFSNYSILDSDVSQNSIVINGITKATDSTKSLINIFKHTVPQENRIAEVLPSNINSFVDMTFDNFDIIRQNLLKHQLLDSLANNAKIYENIVEIGQAKFNNSEVIVLRSIDPSSTLDGLSTSATNTVFRGVSVHSPNNGMAFLNDFAPIIRTTSAKYYINLDDFIIFSSDTTFLESIISNYQNNTTLSQSYTYQDLNLHLSDESSLFTYGDASELNHVINANFTDDKKLNIKPYKSSAVQYIYDTDFAHFNAVFKSYKTGGINRMVREDLNLTLDADLISAPQLVNNHTNNQMDIIAQDINNYLYLISNQGKVLWKKQLDGKVLGQIHQIDKFKNGRLQLVFNTAKRLYVLDRNGKKVNPFPMSFSDEITQPVSVFDYDNKKNYRLMVIQGRNVKMYDKNGKTVSGFTFKSTESNISSQPKHFRINRKDYIAFTHGNKLEILDRTGKKRINVTEPITFSSNEIYLYNNKFTTSNTNGELLEINQIGRVSHRNLNVNNDHKLATTSKTLVVMNDNKLTIKSKTITLDFGDYTAPNIFYINNKIYVSVTDLQSKKGYLFDSQAKAIPNFPVYANSELILENIDKDSALEVITKGDSDTIIVYEIN